MTKRFEIKLAEEPRAALQAIADKTGVPAAALARLAIIQLIEARSVTLPALDEHDREAA